MNSRLIFVVAGGIAAAAIAIFFLFGSGNLRPPSLSGGQSSPPELQNLTLSIADVVVKKTDDKAANLLVKFDAFNPNRNTAILETVHYTVYVQNFRMTSGDIGSTPEGFLSSGTQNFHIVSNTTLPVKDERVATRNNLTASAWDSMVAGVAQFRIEGYYTYQLTAPGFQFTTREGEFSLTYTPS